MKGKPNISRLGSTETTIAMRHFQRLRHAIVLSEKKPGSTYTLPVDSSLAIQMTTCREPLFWRCETNNRSRAPGVKARRVRLAQKTVLHANC